MKTLLKSVMIYVRSYLQTFNASVIGLLKSIKAREEGRSRQSMNPAPTPINRAAAQPTGYSRYDQERFKGKEGNYSVFCLADTK